MKYKVTRCLCWKGDTLGMSINNPRNQENAGTFDTKPQAETYMEKLRKQEVVRIRREGDKWNGNEFVFWVEALNEKDSNS